MGPVVDLLAVALPQVERTHTRADTTPSKLVPTPPGFGKATTSGSASPTQVVTRPSKGSKASTVSANANTRTIHWNSPGPLPFWPLDSRTCPVEETRNNPGPALSATSRLPSGAKTAS